MQDSVRVGVERVAAECIVDSAHLRTLKMLTGKSSVWNILPLVQMTGMSLEGYPNAAQQGWRSAVRRADTNPHAKK